MIVIALSRFRRQHLFGVPSDIQMTVYCEGDCSLVEQLGEKREFEAELTSLGFKHEDFTLHVLGQVPQGPKAVWSDDYSATLSNIVSGHSRVYQGGPKQNWVAQSSLDLANGAYGPPPRSGRAMAKRETLTERSSSSSSYAACVLISICDPAGALSHALIVLCS